MILSHQIRNLDNPPAQIIGPEITPTPTKRQKEKNPSIFFYLFITSLFVKTSTNEELSLEIHYLLTERDERPMTSLDIVTQKAEYQHLTQNKLTKRQLFVHHLTEKQTHYAKSPHFNSDKGSWISNVR